MIVDVNLPDMNGITTTKAIKAFRKELPIIALLTKGHKNLNKEAALIAGCDDYLSSTDSKQRIRLTLVQYLKTGILSHLDQD